VAVDDVRVERRQERRLLAETLLGCGELQNLGDVAQVASLQNKTNFCN